MKRPEWLKRRMPVKRGYVTCRDCQAARFFGSYVVGSDADRKTTCPKHRARRKRGKM